MTNKAPHLRLILGFDNGFLSNLHYVGSDGEEIYLEYTGKDDSDRSWFWRLPKGAERHGPYTRICRERVATEEEAEEMGLELWSTYPVDLGKVYALNAAALALGKSPKEMDWKPKKRRPAWLTRR